MASQLEDIRSVGPKTRVILLSAFQNIQNIRTASVEDLLKVKGVTEKTARAVYDYFNGGEK
ncbi:hypothetical protein SDC9_148840 [bioreactor metagenome]|uniref:Helix-hairpin-helix DNA-binding motif class 1 domain-containing protein n=1 Tax=bioreactor metagenome TaxID=1076179 RepID=A0A645EJY4_9ZZZZ